MLQVLFFRLSCLLVFATAFTEAGALTANFSATTTTGCAPSVIQFNDLSTGGATGWSWDFGNGASSSLQNPSTSYLTPGQYTVSLTVSNGGSTSTQTFTNYISIQPAPVVSFTADDTAGCPPQLVNFINSSNPNAPGAASYIWNFGNGNTSNLQNPSETYTAPGYYNITLAVGNSVGCTTTVVINNYIHIYTPPVAAFSASPTALCNSGLPTTFTSGVTGTGPFSYQWSFGDGGTSTAANPTHTYNSFGAFGVSLIVTDAHGCKDTLTQAGYINVSPLNASFTSPPSICQGQGAYFNNTSTPPGTFATWNFGDGTTGTGITVSHPYAVPGSYTVTMIVSITGGCSDTVTKPIVVNPKPTPGFTISPVFPCPAPSVVQFINTTTNGATYTWNFGDSTTGTGTSPGHLYNYPGPYDVTLYATSGAGCVDSLKITDAVYLEPFSTLVIPGIVNGCVPVTQTFYYSTNYSHPISSHTWYVSDGATYTGDTLTHTFSQYGDYTVMLVLQGSNGCLDTTLVPVQIGNPVTAAFTASPLVVCVHDPVVFNNTSSVGDSVTYLWNFGDGGTSTSQFPVHSYVIADTFSVSLIVADNGCGDTLTLTNYIQVNDPIASASRIYSCDTFHKVNFTNAASGYTSFVWIFGDGATSTVLNPYHIYAGVGPYLAKLAAYNSNTGCSDTATLPISFPVLSLSVSALDQQVCLGDSVHLTGAISGGIGGGVIWYSNGLQLTDTGFYLDYLYPDTGNYTIAFTVMNGATGCRDSLSLPNYLLIAHPYGDFAGSPASGCAPVSVLFTDLTDYTSNAPAISRNWNFGDGNNATVNTTTISHLYNFTGSYPVTLIVTDNVGCSDTIQKPAYINAQAATAAFIASNPNVCIGQQVNFVNQSTGASLTYQWNFGDGTSSTALAPVKSYSVPGTYTVTLITTAGAGCSDTLVKTSYITVAGAPVAAFAMSDSFAICPPLVVQFTNNSTGYNSSNWIFGTGSTSTITSPSNTYVNPGQYTVSLIVTNIQGCKDTATASVTLLGYNGALAYTPLAGCAPLAVQFTATATNVPGFIFDFGDGATYGTSDTFAAHVYTEPGAYVPKLIMTDNQGCTASSVGLDTIKVDGVFAGFTYTPYPACVSGTLFFTDTSHGAYSPLISRLWIFEDGTTSTSATPSHSYPDTGFYPITLITTTAIGCIDTLQTGVTFWPLPLIDAGADTIICLSDAATLQPTGGVSYVWTAAPTLSCTACANPQASPTTPTTYTVTGTDAHGCANTDTMHVGIKTKTSGIAGDAAFCEGTQFQLTASGGDHYTWIPAAGLSDSAAANPSVMAGAGTYGYTVIIKEGSCIADTEQVTVIVHPAATVDAGPDQVIVAGSGAQLNAVANSAVTGYLWTPADSLSCTTCASPLATPKNTTTYVVVAKTDFNCTDTDDVIVYIQCASSQIYIPNSFTPNGNGENDVFFPRGKGLDRITSFKIYDRWGTLVFERSNIQPDDESQGWDGKIDGKAAGPDAYAYIMEAICNTGEKVSWKGDVTLIR